MKFSLVYFDKNVKGFVSRIVFCSIVQVSSDKVHLLFYHSGVLVESIPLRDIIVLQLIYE